MRNLLLVMAVIDLSCVRNPASRSMSDEDPSIVFPEFYEHFPVVVGKEQDQPYELDGVTLRALTIAANDFIPPRSKERPCWQRQESHRYRAIRRGDIIFVRISWDPYYCKVGFGILDGGVKYAISTDGRILRRLFDGEPDGMLSRESSDAGGKEFKGTPIPFSSLGSIYGEPVPNALPPGWLDGGVGRVPPRTPPSPLTVPDGGSAADGGVTFPVDGGGALSVDGGSTAWPLK